MLMVLSLLMLLFYLGVCCKESCFNLFVCVVVFMLLLYGYKWYK